MIFWTIKQAASLNIILSEFREFYKDALWWWCFCFICITSGLWLFYMFKTSSQYTSSCRPCHHGRKFSMLNMALQYWNTAFVWNILLALTCGTWPILPLHFLRHANREANCDTKKTTSLTRQRQPTQASCSLPAWHPRLPPHFTASCGGGIYTAVKALWIFDYNSWTSRHIF